MTGRGIHDPKDVVMLQRQAGNAAVCTLMRTVVPGRDLVIQRTIDQDARRFAMDWLATRARAFVRAVETLRLPRLNAIIDGVLGPVGEPPQQITQVDRATYTTALATALVRLGEKSVGQLEARLADGKPGRDDLLRSLEAQVPAQIPALTLSTAQSAANFAAIEGQLSDPFLTLKVGGASFSFSKQMALHMLRRHHPDYLQGAPMQVQSFFRPGTDLKSIIALIEGSIRSQEQLVKDWRARRRKMTSDELAANDGTTLNLRPFFDGSYWELTLTLPATNPTESKGVVAHFTPTL